MSELHSPPAITALIRTGSEPGYLRSGWDKWMDYCKTRGTTSHPFGAAKAKEAVVIIPDFLPVEQSLYGWLCKLPDGGVAETGNPVSICRINVDWGGADGLTKFR